MIGLRALPTGLDAHGVDRGYAEDLRDLVLGSPSETSILSQPKPRPAADARDRSPTITTEAPRRWAQWAAARLTREHDRRPVLLLCGRLKMRVNDAEAAQVAWLKVL